MLPLNPQQLAGVAPDLAFNTAVSFASNTNWQAYSGETTLSYLTQMLGLTVQNFLSAATGMAVLVAMIRGLTANRSATIGNFWVDVTRSTLYILLPLSTALAIVLASQGVVQSLSAAVEVNRLEPSIDAEGKTVTTQTIPMGPAASQIAIKQLGTNGGGFFGVNSAHPLENPTPLSNFLQVISILLIAAALCYTFGDLVGDTRQGWSLLAVMLVIFVPMLVICIWCEQAGNPRLTELGVDQSASEFQSGGNLEGKEVRFGAAASALWATATTAASNGSVNSMHDSMTPLGGLIPMWLMQLGEVIFGGVGSGLYGLLIFALLAVFVAGLMVGRTPEYLGKKIEAFEMKMAALVVLIPPMIVLCGTALAVSLDCGRASVSNPGPHGLSQILYALSSAGNNNGSAFGGLSVNTPFYNSLFGSRDVDFAVLADCACAGDRGIAGEEGPNSRFGGNPADTYPVVRRARCGHGATGRGADVYSRTGTWSSGRTFAVNGDSLKPKENLRCRTEMLDPCWNGPWSSARCGMPLAN